MRETVDANLYSPQSGTVQGHLKKSAFKDAGKIRSDSPNKFDTLGKLTFLPLIILPATRYSPPHVE